MDIETATRGILDARERLGKLLASNHPDPQQIGDQMNRMALYLTYVGDHLGQLEEQRETNKAREFMRFLKEGKSANQADTLSRTAVAFLTGQIARVKYLHKDGWEYTSRAQSKLRQYENQSRNQL
jgi:hypothetical protein